LIARIPVLLVSFLLALALVAPVAPFTAHAHPLQAATESAPAAGSSGQADKFGVNLGPGSFDPLRGQALALAGKNGIGVGWAREGCGWATVEPAPGTWTWAACDSLISDTVSAGLNPLMTFQYSVPWCTTAPDPGLPVSTISYYPPCDYDQYEDFLKHLVSRYGPKANGYTDGGPGYGQNVVHSWEVGNEPDIKGSFILPPSMPESSAASVYAELLYHAWHAIKSADPTAQVVFGGLALNLSGDPRINRLGFFHDVLHDPTYPGAQYFDIANFHSYGGKVDVRAKMASIQSDLADVGASKPVWITEVGYPSDPSRQNLSPATYPFGEAGQAAFLNDVLSYMLSPDIGAQKVFWYYANDIATDPSPQFCTDGLTWTPGYQCNAAGPAPGNATLVKKQAWSTYQDLLTRVDSIAPTVSVSAPANGAAIGRQSTITVAAADDNAVAKVEIYVDGALAASDLNPPYTYQWDASSYPQNSTHTVYAKVYDGAWNVTTSPTIVVTENSGGNPSVTLANPADGAAVQGKVTLQADASSNNAVTKVEFYVDGALVATDTAAPYTATWDTSTLPAGSLHTIWAKAYDTKNRAMASAAANVGIGVFPNLATPVAPSNLAVAAITTGGVSLSWTNNANDGSSIVVERKTGVNGTYAPVGNPLPAGTASFTDTTTALDTTYMYRVKATNGTGSSPYSNEVTAVTLPSAPAGLRLTSQGSTQVSLAWTDTATSETGYVVERKTGAGAYAQIGSTLPPQTQAYTDKTVQIDTVYTYRVRATNGSGSSDASNELAVTTIPAAPTSLTVVQNTASQVVLSWHDNAHTETGYVVERKQGTNSFAQIGATLPAGTTSFTDTAISPLVSYVYRVKAVNAAGSSDYSNQVSDTPPLGPPPAPTSVAVGAVTSASVALSWSDAAANVSGYVVERALGNGAFAQVGSTLPPTAKTFTDTTVQPETGYSYRVKATSTAGDSPYSSPVAVTTGPAAPTNLATGTVVYGSVELSWTDNTGNATGYVVERRAGSGSYAQMGSTLPASATAFTDTTVAPFTTYTYRVKAVNGNASSSYSNEVTVKTYSRNENSSINVRYTGIWKDVRNAGCSSGTCKESTDPNGNASLTWNGTDVNVVMTKGPQMGKAYVVVDGALVVVDLYAPELQFQQVVFSKTGMPFGSHTVKVSASGAKNPASAAPQIGLDSFDTR